MNAFDPDLVTIALLFFDAFGSIESRGRPRDNESQRDETLRLLVSEVAFIPTYSTTRWTTSKGAPQLAKRLFFPPEWTSGFNWLQRFKLCLHDAEGGLSAPSALCLME